VWGATIPEVVLDLVREFQSTPPVWGATFARVPFDGTFSFQSTPPVWGATPYSPPLPPGGLFQSTPPVWGATRGGHKGVPFLPVISIHAPRVGGDVTMVQSALRLEDFNPRPPCGGRRITPSRTPKALWISIHAPRVGGDKG